MESNKLEMAIFEGNIDLITMLICAEGTRLLQEDGTGETPQTLASRRLPDPPAESEVPGAQINKLI
jgi:hypothetical protein